jgi:hypothetical protein
MGPSGAQTFGTASKKPAEEKRRSEEAHDVAMRVFAHEAPADTPLGRIADLEGRLALLERRLSPSPEWSPQPGSTAEEGLLSGYRLGDGKIAWSPREEASGDAIQDMATGALRPQTWPQLLSCLRVLASSVDILVED